jgi:hypothetical protein
LARARCEFAYAKNGKEGVTVDITVVKRDGTREPFDASEGLVDQISKVVQVATEVQLTLLATQEYV